MWTPRCIQGFDMLRMPIRSEFKSCVVVSPSKLLCLNAFSLNKIKKQNEKLAFLTPFSKRTWCSISSRPAFQELWSNVFSWGSSVRPTISTLVQRFTCCPLLNLVFLESLFQGKTGCSYVCNLIPSYLFTMAFGSLEKRELVWVLCRTESYSYKLL